ncbi:MAG: hypothetical protein NTW67_05030, partial [Candidatus Woesearchaeota archaeon]|nr:hypothetical protein [Candidatus Woesearchaeota archaeon]
MLETIHNALTTQLHIIDKLFSTNDVPGLISHLKSQLAVEQEVLKQIESRETFHELFLTLVKGEHIVSQMDVKEKQLLKRMDLIMKSVFGTERKKGSRYQLAM